MKKEDIVVSNNVEREMKFEKLWFLFCPFGSKTEKTRRESVYLMTCKKIKLMEFYNPNMRLRKL
ncbi:hypothetical protein ABID42_004704 [Arcicella rosea]|uniref:hypothetical protein n=1 Tax=Arcicella rosea TaxID=502909 RepID=UPI00345C7E16